MIRRLETCNRLLSQSLLWIAGAFLIFMMTMACANMVLRALWQPLTGSFELMGFSGAVTAAFALAATQRKKGHITVDFLHGRLPPLAERLLLILSFAASIIFFTLVAWQSGVWAWTLVRSGELSETLHIIYYPFAFAVALGFAALALTLVTDLCLICARSGEDSP